jgi:hypothetical protein
VRKSAVLLLLAAGLLLSACGGGGSSSSSESTTSSAASQAKTPEQVWAKEVEGVMRGFENSSAKSVELIHTSTSQYNLEPTYAAYSDELAKLGMQLEATDPPPSCEKLRDEMGSLAHQVSGIMGALQGQAELSPEEYSALVYQQTFKFSRVGRKLTTSTIHPDC